MPRPLTSLEPTPDIQQLATASHIHISQLSHDKGILIPVITRPKAINGYLELRDKQLGSQVSESLFVSLSLCFCISVCVRAHTRLHVCIYIHVCICVWKSDINLAAPRMQFSSFYICSISLEHGDSLLG